MPIENAIEAFAFLVLSFQWSPSELAECGVWDDDFKAMVGLLRAKLVEHHLIEEGAI